MKALSIAAISVKRLMRDRLNLFFVFVLPTLLIVVIGVVFGAGFTPRVGIVSAGSGGLGEDLAVAIEGIDAVSVKRFDDRQGVVEAVERGDLEVGVVIPSGYETTLEDGGTTSVEYVARPSGGGFDVQALVQAEVAAQAATVRSARFAVDELGVSYGEATDVVAATKPSIAGVTVSVEGDSAASTVGQFDLGAAQNLVLFMFVTSLAASAALILSRKLGVSRRMLSTPTSSRTVIVGETLGRFAVAMTQGLFIAGVAAIVFGVDWGAPLAAGAILVAFAAVGTGAAMLIGSTFSNDEQAGGIGTFLGLGLGALGGCMVPLEVFSPTMRQIAHVTPHAWALDGFSELIRNDGGIGDILLELGVLFGFAAVLIALASWRFRRVITA